MKKRPALTKKEGIALKEFKRRLEKGLGSNLLSMRLFGSKARGEYKTTSDIDLLIIVKKYTKTVEDILIDTRLDILGEFDLYPEIICFSLATYQMYKDLQIPFLQNVEKDGLRI